MSVRRGGERRSVAIRCKSELQSLKTGDEQYGPDLETFLVCAHGITVVVDHNETLHAHPNNEASPN